VGYFDRSMSVPDNQVSIGEYSVTVDLSYFANQGFVLVAEEKGEVWGEKDPFDGRHEVDAQKVEQVFAQAQALIDQIILPPPPTLEENREAASLPRADFKLGLLDMGELDAVKAVMADPDTDPRVVILWEDAERFNRMHPDLLSFAQVMGYTEEQLDALFGILPTTNVNTADFDTLRALHGVDEVRAQAIIDGRPWADVNDLTTIQGISQEMVDSWDITV